MGVCSSAEAAEPVIALPKVGPRSTTAAVAGLRTSGRRGSTLGTEEPELQARLEKLDEERHCVQEELKRLQSAAALEQETDPNDGSSSSQGEKPRVRFSKFDGLDASAPPLYSDRAEQASRRASSQRKESPSP